MLLFTISFHLFPEEIFVRSGEKWTAFIRTFLKKAGKIPFVELTLIEAVALLVIIIFFKSLSVFVVSATELRKMFWSRAKYFLSFNVFLSIWHSVHDTQTCLWRYQSYSEPFQTFKTNLFAKIVDGFLPKLHPKAPS